MAQPSAMAPSIPSYVRFDVARRDLRSNLLAKLRSRSERLRNDEGFCPLITEVLAKVMAKID